MYVENIRNISKWLKPDGNSISTKEHAYFLIQENIDEFLRQFPELESDKNVVNTLSTMYYNSQGNDLINVLIRSFEDELIDAGWARVNIYGNSLIVSSADLTLSMLATLKQWVRRYGLYDGIDIELFKLPTSMTHLSYESFLKIPNVAALYNKLKR